MSPFTEAVERNLKGVHFFSVGACPGCEECGLGGEKCFRCDGEGETDGAECFECGGAGKVASTEHDRECAEEGFFVNSASCDSCGSTLGGQRYPAHGVIAGAIEEAQKKESSITHFDVCVDCLQYQANGEEPEAWQQSSRETERE